MGAPVWQFASLTKVLQLESEHSPNPVTQRVKLVMFACLVIVHGWSRWPTMGEGDESGPSFDAQNANGSPTSTSSNNSIEQAVTVIIVCILAIRYIFFENKEMHKDMNGEFAAKSKTINQNGSTIVYTMDTKQNLKNLEKQEIVVEKHQNQQEELEEPAEHLLVKDVVDCESSECCSNLSSFSPSSTRPTTPITSNASTTDDLDNRTPSKPETPSILITAQDSDTESVFELRQKIKESGRK